MTVVVCFVMRVVVTDCEAEVVMMKAALAPVALRFRKEETVTLMVERVIELTKRLVMLRVMMEVLALGIIAQSGAHVGVVEM